MDEEKRKRWLNTITKHGAYRNGVESAEHYTWRSMVARCLNPGHSAYKYYGGRGIGVCDRWLHYENFLADVGNRPGDWASLDRIDNNKGYNPDNVRWASKAQQQRNKTTTKLYTDGVFVGSLVECAERVGISKELAHWRWKKWGTFEKGKQWQQLQKN